MTSCPCMRTNEKGGGVWKVLVVQGDREKLIELPILCSELQMPKIAHILPPWGFVWFFLEVAGGIWWIPIETLEVSSIIHDRPYNSTSNPPPTTNLISLHIHYTLQVCLTNSTTSSLTLSALPSSQFHTLHISTQSTCHQPSVSTWVLPTVA